VGRELAQGCRRPGATFADAPATGGSRPPGARLRRSSSWRLARARVSVPRAAV